MCPCVSFQRLPKTLHYLLQNNQSNKRWTCVVGTLYICKYVNSRERASEREREGVLQVKLRGKYIHATNDMYICTKGKTKWITSRLWEYSSRSRVWFFIEWVPCSKWKAVTGVVAPASLEIWIAQSGPSRGLAVGLLLCSKKNWKTYKNM